MSRFEYKLVSFLRVKENELEELLNSQGKYGWEVCGTTQEFIILQRKVG